MALYIVAQFHAKPECEQQLSEALLAVVEPTRAEPGCIEIHVCRALRDPATFFIQSAWTDEGEFEKHAELPHTKSFLSRVPQLIDHEFRAVRCARLV
jgi:quinol monooxygenase YgiN